VTGHGLNRRGLFPGKDPHQLLNTAARSALGHIQDLAQLVPVLFPPGVKRAEREVGLSYASSIREYTSTPSNFAFSYPILSCIRGHAVA
jgi:hypothetical protein